MIAEINERVIKFNDFLATEHRFKLISAIDPTTFAPIPWPTWDLKVIPSNFTACVYVLGAHDTNDSSRRGAYVGRASLNSIRHGIRRFLSSRNADSLSVVQIGSSTFCFDVLLVVPVLSGNMRSMACALQEDIIKWNLKSVELFNGPATLGPNPDGPAAL